MAGAAHALQECIDGARRADLANQIHIADVDAELQGGGRHQHLQFAALQPLLGMQAPFLGKTAVMGGDILLAQPLGQMPGHAFDQPSRVDEHQRRAVLADQFGQAIIDLRPHLAGHHRLERRRRQFQRQIASAHMAAVDDGAAVRVRVAGADQEACRFCDRVLGGRQADPRQVSARECLQPLQRQRQMRAALVAGNRVNFIDDHRPAGGEHGPARLRSQQNVQRLRGRHDDVRRFAPHSGALRLRGIAAAHSRADGDVGQVQGRQFFANARERRLEIALYVVRQRFQRRHVNDSGLIRQPALQTLPDQPVDRRQECSEGLA